MPDHPVDGMADEAAKPMLSRSHFDKPLCEICNAPGQRLHTDLPDLTFHSGATGSLSRCTNARCGTLWADPFPTGPTIAGFYDVYYTHSAPGGGGSGPARDVASGAAALKTMLKRVLRGLSGGSARFAPDLRYLQDLPPGRLLDVGCGNGGFLVEAGRRGWEVCGQELDPEAASAARQASGAEVRVGDLLGTGFEAGSFDAVTLSNVLEHLPNPREVLREAWRLLKPGGVLVSVSPNPNSYLARRYGAHWRGLEVPRHLFLLPPGALDALARQSGFDRIETFSTPGAFDLMETASTGIRRADAPDAAPLPPTGRLRRAAIHLATILGRDLGEWSVLVARK